MMLIVSFFALVATSYAQPPPQHIACCMTVCE